MLVFELGERTLHISPVRCAGPSINFNPAFDQLTEMYFSAKPSWWPLEIVLTPEDYEIVELFMREPFKLVLDKEVATFIIEGCRMLDMVATKNVVVRIEFDTAYMV